MADLNASTWIKGPLWLTRDSREWPNNDTIVNVLSTTDPPEEFALSPDRFSSLDVLISRVAYVKRFIRNCRARVKNEMPCVEKFLTVPERTDAYNTIIRRFQSEHMKPVSEGSSIDRFLFLDENNLWRRNTRMVNSCLPESAKNPIYLPKCKDHLLTLLVRNVHERLLHSGVNSTFNEMRMLYTMATMRSVVKRVLTSCVPCRKNNNIPYKYSDPPPLPESRVVPSLPFSHTGVDFVGPFTGVNSQKYYALIFTCLTVRLVHIEPLVNMDTVSTLSALKRFISRRGAPKFMLSDSAPTFKQCSKLVVAFDGSDEQVNTFLSTSGIQWEFTTPHSPWKGALYERLIKDMKKALNVCIGRRKVSFDQFATLVIETEGVLNCRPLTYVPSQSKDESDEGRSIRPIDFIMPDAYLGQLTVAHREEDDNDYRIPTELRLSDVIKRLSQNEAVMTKFWEVWRSAYLFSLRDRSDKSPLQSYQGSSSVPRVGEIVLIVDESGNTPRSSWSMAKILSIEGTTIRLRSSSGRVVVRPPNLLIPLEIRSVETDTGRPDNTPTHPHPMTTRSKKNQ